MNPAADEVSPILKSRLDVAEGEEYEEECGDPQLNIKPGMFLKILESRIQRLFKNLRISNPKTKEVY